MAEKQVVFNGKVYELVGKYYFEKNSTNAGRRNAKQLHIAVWEFYNNQEVPKGYHIHHKDFNHLNNDISNLECLPASEHLSLHGKVWWSKKENKKRGKHFLDKAREKANEWHKSEEGRAWHREHAKCLKNWKPKTLLCEYCGKEFVQNSNQQRFCSNLCANRKRNGYQDIKNTKVKCAFCGKEFIKTSPNKKYCCQQCMVRSNHKYIGETIGICAICGKEFIRKTTIKKYCSKECSKIAHRQHAKNT